MSVVVVGLNHRSAPLGVREAVAVTTEALPKALADLCGREHLEEVALVSTCMRTEVYATTSAFHGAAGDIRGFLADWSGLAPESLADHVYDFHGASAARHLLRVAAGLDSAVLGEGEILRQVREAGDIAKAEGAMGAALTTVWRRAVGAGKRVRSETGIARGVTSLSHTAVMLAGLARVAAPEAGASTGGPCTGSALLAGASVLVVGAGEVAASLVALVGSAPGVSMLTVVNRTPQRAADLARRSGARHAPWGSLADEVAGADVVFAATSSPGAVLDAASVAGPRGSRAHRPLVVVDMAVPRDVSPSARGVDGVKLFDVSDLQASAEHAIEKRRAAVPAAEAIIDEEIARWGAEHAGRSVVPLVSALHAHGEAVRVAEMARVAGRLDGLDPAQRRAVESLSRGIVAKLLHEPTVNLKAAAGDSRGERLAAALEALFEL